MVDKSVQETLDEIVERQGWKLDIPIWEGGVDIGTSDAELATYRVLARDSDWGDSPLIFIENGDEQEPY